MLERRACISKLFLGVEFVLYLQVRMPFFNSLLAGAIPVVLNPGLLQFLPFSDSVPWQELLVQVDPEKITAQKLLIVDILKVGLLYFRNPLQATPCCTAVHNACYSDRFKI